jgi:hypothetical protein
VSSTPIVVTNVNTPEMPIQSGFSWREHFKTPSNMKKREQPFLIENFLPFGVTFLGGPSGHGKTWVALSMAKAMYYGTPFLGFFPVPRRMAIIYLTPEVGESTFKNRLDHLGLGEIDDGFICQTLNDGPAISLTNPYLLAALQDLKPVVFLDTAVRFNPSDDENDSMQTAKGLGNMIFGLLQNGAQAVIPLHHSPKILADLAVTPTLENTLRGTGDLGAIADTVYCVRSSDIKNFRAEICCVKPRDFDPPDSFEIQGRPFIDLEHDIKMVRAPHVSSEMVDAQEAIAVGKAIEINPNATHRELARICHVNKNRIRSLARRAGWFQPEVEGKTSSWQRIPKSECPVPVLSLSQLATSLVATNPGQGQN